MADLVKKVDGKEYLLAEDIDIVVEAKVRWPDEEAPEEAKESRKKVEAAVAAIAKAFESQVKQGLFVALASLGGAEIFEDIEPPDKDKLN